MRNKNSKGVLTIEATIAFTTFAMVMFTLLYLIKIVFTYGVIQHAINQVAKEFASYSYLYSLTLGDLDASLAESTAAGRENFNSTADTLMTTFNAASEMMDSMNSAGSALGSASEGDLSGLTDSLTGVVDSGRALADSLPATRDAISGIASDPKKAIMSIVGVLASEAVESVKTMICGEIVRAMSAEYINTNQGNAAGANARLRSLRVIDGLNGLDFSASRFFSNGSMNIDIVVTYSLEPIVPLKLLPDLNLVNRIYIRGWGKGSSPPAPGAPAPSTSIWNDELFMARGEQLQRDYGLRNLPDNFPVFSKFEGGTATAAHTIDLRAPSYQSQSALDSKVRGCCRAVDDFDRDVTYGGATVRSSDIRVREVVIMIPPSTEAIGPVDQTLLNNTIAKMREEYPGIVIRVVEVDAPSMEA